MNYTVMILDDDPITLFLHKVIIEKSQFCLTPVAFSNAPQTVEYITENFDKGQRFLVFLDINMPGIDGWEFIELLKRKRLNDRVGIIVVSSSIDRADYAKAKRYKEIIAYLEKPISIAMINEVKNRPAVNGILTGKTGEKRL